MFDRINAELQIISEQMREAEILDLYEEWLACMMQHYYPQFYEDWE